MSANSRVPRPRGEARAAILRSAEELFGTRGYHGTSVRDVAQHAGVSEALLYRYFGGKSGLFDEAVIGPYRGVIDSFLGDWQQLEAPASNEEMVTRFVTGLYEFVVTHRSLLFALAAANRFGDAPIDEAGRLSEGVRRLVEFTTAEAAQRGLEAVDLEMAASCTIALVLAVGLLDDLLFTSGRKRPDADRLVREMARYATAGVEQRGLTKPAPSRRRR